MQQDGERRMAMVDEAAKKGTGDFHQQHRRRCPRENSSRHRLESSASLTRIGCGWLHRLFTDDDGLTRSVGDAASQQQPHPQECQRRCGDERRDAILSLIRTKNKIAARTKKKTAASRRTSGYFLHSYSLMLKAAVQQRW